MLLYKTYWVSWIAFICHHNGEVGGNEMSEAKCWMLMRQHDVLRGMQERPCHWKQIHCVDLSALNNTRTRS